MRHDKRYDLTAAPTEEVIAQNLPLALMNCFELPNTHAHTHPSTSMFSLQPLSLIPRLVPDGVRMR